MTRTFAYVALAGFVLGSGAASAQNVSLGPTFGTVNLAAGFAGGIYAVDVIGGGPVNAGESVGTDALGTLCEGEIATPPDFRLQYSSDGAPLILLVRAREDTALIINAPDGSWYCNDDGAGWPDPMIAFAWPISGQYDIWIGAFDGKQPEASLIIAEDMRLLPPPAVPAQ